MLSLWRKSLRKKVSDLVYGEKSPRKSLRFGLRRKVTEKKSPKKSLRFSLRNKVTDIVGMENEKYIEDNIVHRKYIEINVNSMEKKSPKKVSDLVYGEKSPKKSLQTSLRKKVTEKKSPIWFTEKSHREKVSNLIYGEKSPKKSLRFGLRRKVTEKKSPI
ncbi:hypothetical protein SSS_08106 [Sarcoptes scabiei]|uniref:Uncharacterized protein n=1 Tax=Sarcoptes scabiei TaxID=52283 RepID=A0A834VJ75_SARSC|nr:hypothetical protein SSS_08106 [Sarcoptes scabiei]